MNKKKPILTLLLSLFLFTMVMTTGVGATVTTNAVSPASIANYTLYFNSTNGKLYTNEDMTNPYTGQSDKWSPYEINDSYYALRLNGFNFTTSQPNGLVIPDDTSIILADGTTNTITSTYNGSEISSALWGIDRIYICGEGSGTGSLLLQGGSSTGSNSYSDGIYVENILTIGSGHIFAYGGQDSQSSGIDTANLNYYSGELVAKGNDCSINFLGNIFNGTLYCPECPLFFGGSDAQHVTQLDIASAHYQTYPYFHIYSILTDVSYNSWYYQNIYDMYNAGFIKGYANSDGLSYEIHPNSTITRAEFVAILARLFYSENDLNQFAGNYTFNDVPSWASKYVGWATKNGFVQGYDSSTFGAADNISREQMASILDRIVTRENLTSSVTKTAITFTDANDIATYAKNAVANMQKAGVISGYSNGNGTYSFNPKGQATRAEAITMIKNFLTAYAK